MYILLMLILMLLLYDKYISFVISYAYTLTCDFTDYFNYTTKL